MKGFTYVERNIGQTAFDVVRRVLSVRNTHGAGVETLAMLAAVLICYEPELYCTEGLLNEPPGRTVRRVLELPVVREDSVVRRMFADNLLVQENGQTRIVATDRVQALLAYIHMYFGQFQVFDQPTQQELGGIAEAVRRACGGDPLKIAAVAYKLLPSAGAPLP